MKLAGFLILVAAIFSAAYLAGARFGPLNPGGARIQYTGTSTGDTSPDNMGGMQMNGSP